jgi:septal ring factor EnvC (AmiA/AmiB activator)
MRKTLSELEEEMKILKSNYQLELDLTSRIEKDNNRLWDQNNLLQLEIERKDRQINDLTVQNIKLREDLHKAEERIKQLDKTMVSFISHE